MDRRGLMAYLSRLIASTSYLWAALCCLRCPAHWSVVILEFSP